MALLSIARPNTFTQPALESFGSKMCVLHFHMTRVFERYAAHRTRNSGPAQARLGDSGEVAANINNSYVKVPKNMADRAPNTCSCWPCMLLLLPTVLKGKACCGDPNTRHSESELHRWPLTATSANELPVFVCTLQRLESSLQRFLDATPFCGERYRCHNCVVFAHMRSHGRINQRAEFNLDTSKKLLHRQ